MVQYNAGKPASSAFENSEDSKNTCEVLPPPTCDKETVTVWFPFNG